MISRLLTANELLWSGYYRPKLRPLAAMPLS
jgi:hypothetical protein